MIESAGCLRRGCAALLLLLAFVCGLAISSPAAVVITAFRLTETRQAEVHWSGATSNVTVQFSTALSPGSWTPLPGTAWPVTGTSWTGALPSSDSALFLRLVSPTGASGADLVIYDVRKDDLGLPSWFARVPHNSNSGTDLQDLGHAYQGAARFGRGFRIRNEGTATLAVYAISLNAKEEAITLASPVQGDLVELPPGGRLDFTVQATTDQPGLLTGRVEVVSNDPVEPVYAFNVAAAVGEARPLLCSGDNDNWVEDSFSCQGKPDGILCGSDDPDGRHSRVCNHGACVLMGDLNGDGKVTMADAAALEGDINGDGKVNQEDDALKTARFNGQWALRADFGCDGDVDLNTPEHRLMLANLIADFPDAEAFNSRVVETCQKRDLVANLNRMLEAKEAGNPTWWRLNQYPDKGLGYVFTNGYIDFVSMRALEPDGVIKATTPMRYKEPVLACLDSLGYYDLETGALIPQYRPPGDFQPVLEYNDGRLTGRYLETSVVSGIGLGYVEPIRSAANDFRVYFRGEVRASSAGVDVLYPHELLPDGLPQEVPVPRREANLWAAQVQLYYDITRYRNVFFNTRFTRDLRLASEIRNNLLFRQYRPDLIGAIRTEKPRIVINEVMNPAGVLINPFGNAMVVAARFREDPVRLVDEVELPPELAAQYEDIYNAAYDSSGASSDYAGLIAEWVIADNRGFPSESGFGQFNGWKASILPALNDGMSVLEADRMVGVEHFAVDIGSYLQRWRKNSYCKTGVLPCDYGPAMVNPMMYSGDDHSGGPSTFPFYDEYYVGNPNFFKGIAGSDLAGLYIAAISIEIGNFSGIGLYRSASLLWKSLSLIEDRDSYPLAQFGSRLVRAARVLFPSEPDLHEAVREVLNSRGIPLLEISSDFRTQLRPAALDSRGVKFASPHPLPHTQVLGAKNTVVGEFVGDPDADYYALQFYEHSRLGPCDSFEITNGRFLDDAEHTYEPAADRPFRKILEGEEMQNLFLLAPGSRFSWKVNSNRCASDFEGLHTEDVAAFGFQVVKAIKNGFGVRAVRVPDESTVAFQVEDPSGGLKNYDWQMWDLARQPIDFRVDEPTVQALVIGRDDVFTTRVERSEESGASEAVLIPPFGTSVPYVIDCYTQGCDD